ncbi:MAG TPA: hypothetical protein DDW29_15290 [Gammaproteobacteria bacterium]|nr:hypothetical protein [Gammaproteobacteria bacterium]
MFSFAFLSFLKEVDFMIKNICAFTLISIPLFVMGVFLGKNDLLPEQVLSLQLSDVKSETAHVEPEGRNREWLLEIFEDFSPKADVAFVGDSITDGVRWNEFFRNVRVINRGISNDKTADILLRLDSIESAHPNKAFIMVGINDINNDVPLKDILANYEKIAQSLSDAGSEVYIQSTIQCNADLCGDRAVATVNKLNVGLKQIAKKYEYNFVDLGELSSVDGLDRRFTIDGVHLGLEGYRYWTRQITPLVSEDIALLD